MGQCIPYLLLILLDVSTVSFSSSFCLRACCHAPCSLKELKYNYINSMLIRLQTDELFPYLLVSVFVGTCLTTFVITALYEGLKIFRQWLVSRSLRLLIKDLWKSRSTSEDITDNDDATSNKETLQQHAGRFPRQR